MSVMFVRDKAGNLVPVPTIRGDAGKSAYETATEGGYAGTEEEFAAALAGLTPSAGMHTALARSKRILHIMCSGLSLGKDYAVHLYALVRRRGNQQDLWRHPSNVNTGKGYTGKGYANLVGQYYKSDRNKATSVYPAVPEWMPNSGILQTEWLFTAEAGTHSLQIDLEQWILPMLKPLNASFDNGCGLIGVANRCSAPLLMQFRVVRLSDGAVGQSSDTLRIGSAVADGIRVSDGAIAKGSLYCSII